MAYAIVMHLGQAMTVMVLFLIICGKCVCLTFVEGLFYSVNRCVRRVPVGKHIDIDLT